MEWVTIVSLILVGLVLLIVEIVFVPGTTLVGIVGFALMMVGIVLTFKHHGSEAGWISLGMTSVLSGVVLYFSFTTNVWKRFSLKSSIDSKVNEGELNDLKEGMEGKTVSALRPVGKAELNNRTFEVRTSGTYLDSGSKVRIKKISLNQIFVEPIN
ncbi:MAG: NfeD family protein [Flammeovirgaceae bacterium]